MTQWQAGCRDVTEVHANRYFTLAQRLKSRRRARAPRRRRMIMRPRAATDRVNRCHRRNKRRFHRHLCPRPMRLDPSLDPSRRARARRLARRRGPSLPARRSPRAAAGGRRGGKIAPAARLLHSTPSSEFPGRAASGSSGLQAHPRSHGQGDAGGKIRVCAPPAFSARDFPFFSSCTPRVHFSARRSHHSPTPR
jgi:hypothetical protein